MFVKLIIGTLTVAMTTGMSMTSKKCDPDMYFDPAIGRCDTCSVICEFSEFQGTVKECRSKCPEYLKKSVTAGTVQTTLANQGNKGKDADVPPEIDDLGKKVKDNEEDEGGNTLNNVHSMTATLIAIAAIVSFGLLICVVNKTMNSKWFNCRKNQVTCSQESVTASFDSTAPLMQSGPIAQERPIAHQESGAQSEYQGDLVQGQSEYRGELVQGQSEYRGELVQGQSEYQGDLVQGQSEYRGELVQGQSQYQGDLVQGQSQYQGDLVQGQSQYQGDLVQEQSQYQGDLVQEQSEYQGDLVQEQSEYQGDLVQDWA